MSKLSKTENGKKVCESVLSTIFWQGVDDCLISAQPLLQVLRIADGDERSALAEVVYAVDFAKIQIKKAFGSQKLAIQNKVIKIIDDRWRNQMGKPLYGAALFLNPGKYFDILEQNPTWASQIREDFNDVLEKMVSDRETGNNISKSADAYKNSRENGWKIQQALVEIGDKYHSFVGSREWIGATELSFVLDKLLGYCEGQ